MRGDGPGARNAARPGRPRRTPGRFEPGAQREPKRGGSCTTDKSGGAGGGGRGRRTGGDVRRGGNRRRAGSSARPEDGVVRRGSTELGGARWDVHLWGARGGGEDVAGGGAVRAHAPCSRPSPRSSPCSGARAPSRRRRRRRAARHLRAVACSRGGRVTNVPERAARAALAAPRVNLLERHRGRDVVLRVEVARRRTPRARRVGARGGLCASATSSSRENARGGARGRGRRASSVRRRNARTKAVVVPRRRLERRRVGSRDPVT